MQSGGRGQGEPFGEETPAGGGMQSQLPDAQLYEQQSAFGGQQSAEQYARRQQEQSGQGARQQFGREAEAQHGQGTREQAGQQFEGGATRQAQGQFGQQQSQGGQQQSQGGQQQSQGEPAHQHPQGQFTGQHQQPQGQPPQQQQGQSPQQQQGQSPQEQRQPQGQSPQQQRQPQGQPPQQQRQPQGQSPQQQRQPQGQYAQQQQRPRGQFAQQQSQPRGQAAGRPQQSRGRQPGRPRMQPASIDEILQTDVVTADRDTPIPTVVAAMAEYDVGSVVVVEKETPVGILTDRKVALALEESPNVTDAVAEDLLSGSLVTGTSDMTVFEALDRLSEEEIRRLPVVDEDGSLLGIVTLDDLLCVLGRELGKATSIIEAQSPRI